MDTLDSIIDAYKRLGASIQILRDTVPGRTRNAYSLKVDRRLSELKSLPDNALTKPEVIQDFLREQGLDWESKKEDICISK
jgi:hypothetical protein